jgi:hypothetical protein
VCFSTTGQLCLADPSPKGHIGIAARLVGLETAFAIPLMAMLAIAASFAIGSRKED